MRYLKCEREGLRLQGDTPLDGLRRRLTDLKLDSERGPLIDISSSVAPCEPRKGEV